MTARTRPVLQITLSPEAIDRLTAYAAAHGLTRSGAIEQLVRRAKLPSPATSEP